MPRVKAKAKAVIPATSPEALAAYNGRDPYAEPSFDHILKDAEQEEQEELKQATKPASDDLAALAQEMQAEKEEVDRLEAAAKQHKDRYNQIRETLLPDLMKQKGVIKANGKGSFTFAGGRVHLETKLFASCPEEQRAKFFAWAQKNGAGDLIKPTVNAQTLAAFIRERRGDNLKDPPGVSIYEKIVAKITK